MTERRPSQSIERSPSLDALSASASITVSDKFKGLLSEAARKVNGWVKKGTLTTSALSLIIASGCGNTREAEQITSAEPIPISTPNATITPIEIPISTSTIPASETAPVPFTTPLAYPPESPKPTEDIKFLKETPKAIEYHYMDVSDDIKLAVDKEGLPAKYIILSTNEEVYFDREEMRKLKEKAISSKEPEIITMFLQENRTYPEFSYKESNADKHPKNPDLPKDIVSEEILEKRGITILQPENTNLFIREGAFAKGGILEDFNNERGRLNIVFLNGSIITQKYLNNPKYAEIIDQLPKEYISVSALRKSKISYAEYSLEIYRLEPSIFAGKEDLREIAFLDRKADIYRYKEINFMTDDQVAKEGGYFIGRYVHKSLMPPAFNNMSPFIFLSVDRRSYFFPTIFFKYSGEIAVRNLYEGSRRKSFPTEDQTYPDPDDFKINLEASPENRDYIYPYNEHLGFALRHELSHRAITEEQIKRNEIINTSEYHTDKHAMQGVKEAWERWVRSEYADDIGYPFVFSLTKEQGGGYILTRKGKNRHRKLKRKLRAKTLKEISVAN